MVKLLSGRQLVFSAGQSVRITDQSQPVLDVDITALETNTGSIYVGNENVGATAGNESGYAPLKPGDTITFEDVDLFEIWIDAGTDEDGVHWGATVNEKNN